MTSAQGYIPIDRRHALASHTTLPDRTSGAVLFADISGFTPMTEALVRNLGPKRGAEELTRQLNHVYDALIFHVHQYHGSVISFAGDAITCWFDADSGLQATACALAMQQTMQSFAAIEIASGETIPLAMKAAVASGAVRRFLVGDPEIQYIEVLAGATLDRMASAEKQANKGDVVLTPETATELQHLLTIVEWRGEEGVPGYAIVTGITCDVATNPWTELPAELTDEQVRPWVLPPVYDRLTHGQQFLAELRPGVPLFLRFEGIDYDHDEEAGPRLNTYICWIQRVLARYGGFLLQLIIGDKGSYMCAAFGAPLAHDNDPERAVATALELRTPPPECQAFIRNIQIGITRGELRAGAYGSSTRHVYGVHGDEVNLAARLMSYARPGDIAVSQRIVHATEKHYRHESKGSIQVKGKTIPIEVSLALGRKQLSQHHLVTMTLHPLVGRTHELEQVEGVLEALHTGNGHIIRIEGEAGIGKSHLAAEVAKRATERGVQTFSGVCQSTSQSIAYAPWRQIFRAFFALPDAPRDSDYATSDRDSQVAQLETMLHFMNPDWLLRLPLLGDLLDIPIPDNATTAAFDARLRQEALVALVVDILRTWTSDTPLLLLLEDIHWMDELSAGLTMALGRVLARVPIVLVLVHRPVLEDGGMGTSQSILPMLNQFNQLSYHRRIDLNELSPEAVSKLVMNRLQGPVSPLALSLIQSHTQGNPFFVEELVDALRESERLYQLENGTWNLSDSVVQALHESSYLIEDEEGQVVLASNTPVSTIVLDIPDSLQSIVVSRMDRLPEANKLTLKVASVIGRTFELEVLAKAHPSRPAPETISEQIHLFQQRDFTRIETPEPHIIYIFKHNITRDVVYETLLETQQRTLHRAVGETLEHVHPDAIEQLAYHYSRSEVRDKTLFYLEKAAHKAQHDYANETARRYYQQALALEERWEWWRGLVEVLHMMGEREEEEAALHRLESMPDAPRFIVAYRRGTYYEAISDYPQAQHATEQALAICTEQGERMNEVRCLSQLGMIARRQGDYAGSRQWYTRALERIQFDQTESGQLVPEIAQAFAQVLDGLGTIHRYMGSFDEARTCYEQALNLNRTSTNRRGEADVLNNLGNLAADVQRDFQTTLHYYDSALQLRRMIGDRTGEGATMLNIAQVLSETGDYSRSLDTLLAALAIQQATNNLWEQANILNSLGIIHQELGNLAQAQQYLQEGLDLSKEIGDEAGQAYILANLGLVMRDQNNLEQASAHLHEGLTLAREQDDPDLISGFLSYLGTVSLTEGAYEQTQEYINEALHIQRELDLHVRTTMGLTTLATLHLQEGQPDKALDYVRQAIDILNECGGEGPETPQQDYFICFQVLKATGHHEQARSALHAAYELVMERADKITDPVLRQSFLKQVAINHQVVSYAKTMLQ
jgi:class 3 adenylate cyclase/tetratricopeptide (TPR) repeat protein